MTNVTLSSSQVGFERHWLYFLDEYVRPMQEKVFIGYFKRVIVFSHFSVAFQLR